MRNISVMFFCCRSESGGCESSGTGNEKRAPGLVDLASV